MRKVVLAILIVFAALSDSGCAFQYSGDAEMDFDYLVNDLSLSGMAVEETGETYLVNERKPVFSGAGRYIGMENEASLSVWEYRSEACALKETEFISADGFDIIRPAGEGDDGFAGHFDWIAPPHWYHSGRIIVLYVGETPELRTILNKLLGEQFAGE